MERSGNYGEEGASEEVIKGFRQDPKQHFMVKSFFDRMDEADLKMKQDVENLVAFANQVYDSHVKGTSRQEDFMNQVRKNIEEQRSKDQEIKQLLAGKGGAVATSELNKSIDVNCPLAIKLLPQLHFPLQPMRFFNHNSTAYRLALLFIISAALNAKHIFDGDMAAVTSKLNMLYTTKFWGDTVPATVIATSVLAKQDEPVMYRIHSGYVFGATLADQCAWDCSSAIAVDLNKAKGKDILHRFTTKQMEDTLLQGDKVVEEGANVAGNMGHVWQNVEKEKFGKELVAGDAVLWRATDGRGGHVSLFLGYVDENSFYTGDTCRYDEQAGFVGVGVRATQFEKPGHNTFVGRIKSTI